MEPRLRTVARPFKTFSFFGMRVPRSSGFCRGGYDAVCTARFSGESNPALQAASCPPLRQAQGRLFAKNAKSGATILWLRRRVKGCAMQLVSASHARSRVIAVGSARLKPWGLAQPFEIMMIRKGWASPQSPAVLISWFAAGPLLPETAGKPACNGDC
jgi:hypothetical protein